MDLRDKVVLLTGAKRIGAVVAAAVAQAGADVAIAYHRSATEAQDTAAVVRGHGRRALVVQADLAQPADCERIVASTLQELGRVDVLVAMAGIYGRVPFDELSLDDWNAQMDIELRSAFLCARAAVPSMRGNGAGRIILFTDWLPTSERPRYAGFLTYYVAKAGLKALTEALALELAADQILVNAVAPGPIVAPANTSEKEMIAVAQSTPLGRWGGEAEIAKAVMFLIETDFVTGETIRVDGGRHLK